MGREREGYQEMGARGGAQVGGRAKEGVSGYQVARGGVHMGRGRSRGSGGEGGRRRLKPGQDGVGEGLGQEAELRWGIRKWGGRKWTSCGGKAGDRTQARVAEAGDGAGGGGQVELKWSVKGVWGQKAELRPWWGVWKWGAGGQAHTERVESRGGAQVGAGIRKWGAGGGAGGYQEGGGAGGRAQASFPGRPVPNRPWTDTSPLPRCWGPCFT